MGLTFKIFPLLLICVLISAQEVEDSDRQSVQRPSVFDSTHIKRIVERVGGRAKQASSHITRGIQSFLNNIRQRTQDLEESIKDEQAKLRTEVEKALIRINVIDKERLKLSQHVRAVNSTFFEKVEEYKIGLKEQKDSIDNQIKVSAHKGSAAATELETESKNIDEKMKNADGLFLIPQTRGLGDGYGKHLK